MEFIRTDDSRFADLDGFDFAPHYSEIDDLEGGKLRLQYIDEGPKDGEIVLCLHGEPTWSYLYRHMIPVFTGAGHRAIAPDLIGFGRSDKPLHREDYSYARHVAWMRDWVQQLDLRGITLVAQDWGGLIGLRLVAEMPERFAQIVVANTALPTGDQPMGDAFKSWRDYSQKADPFDAGRIVYGGTSQKISAGEIAAYNAPFPDESYKAGARAFPMLVPDSPDNPASEDNRAAWKVLRSLDVPVLTAFGADDRIMAGVDAVFQKLMPGAAGQPHQVLPNAGHFLQEDVGPELAKLVVEFVAAN